MGRNFLKYVMQTLLRAEIIFENIYSVHAKPEQSISHQIIKVKKNDRAKWPLSVQNYLIYSM